MSSPSPQPALSAPASAVPPSATDISCRLPLLVLFVSAAKWLVIGSVFGLIASLKFHSPNFLADYSWLTYGRVHPACTNSILYGACVQAALGVILWLFAQMGAVPLVHRWLVTVGAIFWNLGVTLGVIGILAGDSTGFEHLEMPGYASILVMIGYLMIALWAVVLFHQRRVRALTASHWFLFTALFWFPWIYSTANLLLVTFPVRGMAQAVIAWWFSQNLLVVWFGLAGLGTLFHFVPRLAGRPLHSAPLALFAYWVLILFAGWGGIPTSASVPAWMPTLSTVGTVLSLLAFIAAPLNVCRTLDCSFAPVRRTPLLGFFVFAVSAFALGGFGRAACALLDSAPTLHFTWITPALSELTYYGFFLMVMFGAVYVVMPRLFGLELGRPGLIRAHLWLSVLGVLLIVVPQALSGLLEQARFVDSREPFAEIMRSSLVFLRISTMGDLLLLAANALFLANLIGAILGFYRSRAVSTYEALTEDLFKPAGAKP